MNERILPKVGLTYKARAKSWDVTKSQQGNVMVEVRFQVRTGTYPNGTPAYWERSRTLVFTEGARKRNLESLHYLGMTGDDPGVLWGGKGQLPAIVEITIDPPRVRADDAGNTITGEPEIGWVNQLGGVRIGTPITQQEAQTWGARIAEMARADRANPAGPSSGVSKTPVGFEGPSQSLQTNSAVDDDIPF